MKIHLFYKHDKYLLYKSLNKYIFIETLHAVDKKSVTHVLYLMKIEFSNKHIMITCDERLQKPIYYYLDKHNNVYCASHVHLLKSFGIKIEENLNVLPELFLFNCISTPNTLFKSIFLLGIGEILTIYVKNKRCKVKTSLKKNSYRPILEKNKSVIKLGLDRITNQLIALSKSGLNFQTLLSGGMDSSILSYISKNVTGNIKTYSTDYPLEFGYDSGEKIYALTASEAIKTDHTHHEFTKEDYFKELIYSVKLAEMPVFHLQSVALLSLFKNSIPSFHKLLLCGQGADTITGTRSHEKTYKTLSNATSYHKLPFKPVFKAFFIWLYNKYRKGYVPYHYFKQYVFSKDDVDFEILYAGSYGNFKWVMRTFPQSKKQMMKRRLGIIKKYKKHDILDLLTRYLDSTNCALTQLIWSRLAEGCNKNLFYPFKDPLVNRIFSNISWKIKLSEKKHVIKAMCKLINIPSFIYTRNKNAFGFDVCRWGGKNGLFLKLIDAFASGYLKNKSLDELINFNTIQNAMTLWNILNYFIWRKLFIEEVDINSLSKQMQRIISNHFDNIEGNTVKKRAEYVKNIQ